MTAPVRVLAIAMVVAALTACSNPVEQQPTPSPTPRSGGTLRVAILEREGDPPFAEQVYADPGRPTPAFLMRCCLARTLLTYPGRTTNDGGTVLQPDLAESMPSVSSDGLTWTFRIRPGIKYAPPHADIELTSTDFVTTVERSIRINNEVSPPFDFVAGVHEFQSGSASSVSGLQTPDAHTLVIRLAKQYGGLDWVADPAWAPIPASVAVGHDEDLGLYWPSTGPYMYEAYPADSAAAGATLIRNPSWSAETDATRQASVDRIELVRGGSDLAAQLARLEGGEIDFVNTRLDDDSARRYRSDPQTTGRVRSTASEYLYRLPMNLAVPPFDDLAVRRAVAFALDRGAARDAIINRLNANGTPRAPTVLSAHMFADSVTGGLLVGYDPYTLGDGLGNISRARTEMTKSRYDTDADGQCDAAICGSIQMPSFDLASAQAIAPSLEAIGLHVEPIEFTPGDEHDMSLPLNHVALALLPFGWGFELSGSELAVLVSGGEGIAPDGFAANPSLVGARPQDLQTWSYPVTAVPSVDDVIDRCDREFGNRRARCWAELDQLVAESIAPWAPLFAYESVWVASPRVADYALDQAMFQQFPALENVSLVTGSP